MNFYEKVRMDNREKYGTRASDYMPIIINQYSDRTHFIYEIIQNAEDAGATKIKFCLKKDRLIIYHNGRPFNEDDVNGVCGIADGTKNDGTRIGHFGIGFKAVYGYTSTPEIHSGKFCFKIVEYVNPFEISQKDDLKKGETCLVLPFDKEAVTKEIAFKEISEALVKKVTAESILMLDSIVDVEIDIENRRDLVCINKEKGAIKKSNNVFEISLQSSYINKTTKEVRETENKYIYFTDAEKKASAIVFKIKEREIQEIKNNKLFAFFPMAIESHQAFYIHAPFDTNPARNEILKGEEYGYNNYKLIENICRLISYAFIWFRDEGYLTFSALTKTYPIYEYEDQHILRKIYENSIELISEGEPILPTNIPGVYKSISEICIPDNMAIANVFSDDDLKALIGKKNIFWLSKEVQARENLEFKRFLDNNFEFKTYEWRHLVVGITASFLKTKNINWIGHLMSNIESFCVRRINQQSHYIDVSKIPFVKISNGEFICAKRDGVFQVYLNNPDICERKIAKDYLDNDDIVSFLKNALEVSNYNLEIEVKEKILPKYETPNVKFMTDNHFLENITDLKEIRDAISLNPSIAELAKEKYIVTDGKNWCRPEELHIQTVDSRAGYHLVKDIIDLKYLSPKYLDDTVMSIKLDVSFFRKIGCSFGLREEHISKNEYINAVSKYIDRNTANDIESKVLSKTYISKKFDWNFKFEGFPEVFKEMNPDKSRSIAKFLNSRVHDFVIEDDLVGANDQNFSGSNADSVVAYSMIGLIICYERWIYIKGDPEPHRPIDVDKNDLISGYEPAEKLIKHLPFKEVKDAIFDYLSGIYKDKSDIELVKRMMADPVEMLKIAKAKSKSEAKRAANEEKKSSIKERYEKADKKQIGNIKDNDLFETSSISEKALARREEKLEEELINSLQNNNRVARGLSYARRQSNAEERLFLEGEYDGSCQICLKNITKYDGKKYFEAINIIKPSSLHDKVANTVGLGWNSLSLCPNCAAEYNYCSKKISDFYEQVIEQNVVPGTNEPIEIKIQLPEGKDRTIKYSPRHFLVLKKAFEIFENEE